MAEYHKCVMDDCNAQIVEQHLMCTTHWYKVPTYLRQIIWSTYRTRKFGRDYYRAVEQARQIVASTPKDVKRAPSWREILGPNGLRTKPRVAS